MICCTFIEDVCTGDVAQSVFVKLSVAEGCALSFGGENTLPLEKSGVWGAVSACKCQCRHQRRKQAWIHTCFCLAKICCERVVGAVCIFRVKANDASIHQCQLHQWVADTNLLLLLTRLGQRSLPPGDVDRLSPPRLAHGWRLAFAIVVPPVPVGRGRLAVQTLLAPALCRAAHRVLKALAVLFLAPRVFALATPHVVNLIDLRL